MSATVYNLILSPNDLEKSVSKKDFTDEEGNLDQAAYEAAVAAKQDQMVRDLMAPVPGLDEERVDTQVHATKYSYREIKKNIEEEEAQAIPGIHHREQDLRLPIPYSRDQTLLPLLRPSCPGPGVCQ